MARFKRGWTDSNVVGQIQMRLDRFKCDWTDLCSTVVGLTRVASHTHYRRDVYNAALPLLAHHLCCCLHIRMDPLAHTVLTA